MIPDDMGIDDLQFNTGGAKILFDGVPGMGWCEFSWNKDYFDFAKSFVVEFG